MLKHIIVELTGPICPICSCPEQRISLGVIRKSWLGVNRSGLVTALVTRAITGCSGKDAIDLVREKRVFPREVREYYAARGITHALCNESFVQWLEALPALPET